MAPVADFLPFPVSSARTKLVLVVGRDLNAQYATVQNGAVQATHSIPEIGGSRVCHYFSRERRNIIGPLSSHCCRNRCIRLLERPSKVILCDPKAI